MKKVIWIVLGLISMSSIAQQDFVMHGIENLPQSQYINPAYHIKAKAYFNLPALNFNLGASHSGFQLNHLINIRPDDSLELTPDIAIGKMANVNYVTTDFNQDLLALGFSVKDNFFSLTVSNRFQSRFIYPKDLLVLGLEGNGKSLLGERASLDGLGFELMAYLEAGIGYNRIINDKLTLGGKLKYIRGLANIHTEKSNLGIHTDETTFDITIDGELALQTSNTLAFADTNDLNPGNWLSIGPGGQTGLSSVSFSELGRSNGFGIDLGANYQINDQWSVNASVVDLGFVNWTSNIANYQSSNVNFLFQGIDIEEFLTDSSDVFQTFLDSAETVFTVEENQDTYRTSLYTKIYLGGNYQVNEKLTLGADWYSEFITSRYRTAVSLNATFTPARWFTLAGNYTIYARDYKNIGLGFAVNAGPVQWYLMSDNVIGFAAADRTKNWHLRTGINFLIGREKKEDGPGSSSFSE